MDSVTVWDDEAQYDKRQPMTPRYSQEILNLAVRKGMPSSASHYSRRNDSDTGTIFEWE